VNGTLENALREVLRGDDLDEEADVAAVLAGMRAGITRRHRYRSAAVAASSVLVLGVALGTVALGQHPAPVRPGVGPSELTSTLVPTPPANGCGGFGDGSTAVRSATSAPQRSWPTDASGTRTAC
jgi:hypothetical protein